MKKVTIEINEYQLVIYHTIRALYEDYGSALPPKIEKELENFVNLLGNYLEDDVEGDIEEQIFYRKTIYKYE